MILNLFTKVDRFGLLRCTSEILLYYSLCYINFCFLEGLPSYYRIMSNSPFSKLSTSSRVAKIRRLVRFRSVSYLWSFNLPSNDWKYLNAGTEDVMEPFWPLILNEMELSEQYNIPPLQNRHCSPVVQDDLYDTSSLEINVPSISCSIINYLDIH